MSFFEAPRPPAGDRAVELVLGDLRIRIEGLDHEKARAFLERYGPYGRESDARGGDVALRVSLGLESREYFIPPPETQEPNPVWLAFDPGRVRYLGYKLAGWFESAGGRGAMLLAQGAYEPDIRSFENYVRSAVAWLAASRGGALVHAASAVWRGRAYIFYGESGAGKSTLSAANRRARVVSDDLSLLLPASGGGLDLIGSPFRGTYEEGSPVEGRFPLAAGFRLIQAQAAAVHRVPRVRAMAELVGNLPFVAEAFPERPELFEGISRSFDGIPLAHLHFRKDDTYWDAIDRADLGWKP